ncbi:unnamed protein product [Paramecium octaurelia]|uniref:Uncharacterized protein n=1 Tax=Paramecium octaurelia TaxID=43137 RepID=A0A8S1YJS2_PAROT|nr:unnamed protein product [Paramecium octaurelia]
MKRINLLINSIDNSQEIIQQLKEIKQGYNRKDDFYQVLTQAKNFDEFYLNELLQMLRNKKITNCLEFFKSQTELKFIASMIQNVSGIDINKKNYSNENYDQIRKGLIKQISYDQYIIKLMKFLVGLTAIDERFIQSGSNALNFLVEMKIDLREQSLENKRLIKSQIQMAIHQLQLQSTSDDQSTSLCDVKA